MQTNKIILLLLLFLAFAAMICSMFVNEEFSKWLNRAACLIIVFVMIMIIRLNKNK